MGLHSARIAVFFSSLTLVLTCGINSSAQVARTTQTIQGPAAPLDAASMMISKRVDEVNLAFTVTDKHGHFVSNLAASDFDIKDNQLSPSQFKYFQQQSELPMRVGVLIDCSDSIRYRFDFEQHAAQAFLNRVLRAGKDQAMLVTFNSSVHLVRDMSENFHDLSNAVGRISPGGNTALYDAVVFAAAKLQNSPPETRKAIILITDGDDTGSRALLYDAEQAAVRAQVTLFALSTNDLQLDPYSKGEAVLDLLSQQSGGRLLPAHDEVQLGRSFRMVEKALRNQYALAYQPPDFKADGSFRKIQVVPRKKGLVVQCRRGYYARREEAVNQQRLKVH